MLYTDGLFNLKKRNNAQRAQWDWEVVIKIYRRTGWDLTQLRTLYNSTETQK